MDISELAQQLANQAEAVARHLLPGGKLVGGEWVCGSTDGESGQSCKVRVTGGKRGVWADFAAGTSGDLIDLWRTVRGLDMKATLAEVKDYLGVFDPASVPKKQKTFRRPERPKGATKPKEKVRAYMESRKLTARSIEAFRVAGIDVCPVAPKEPGPWMVFPFQRDGELVFVKYLSLERPGGKKIVRAEAECEPCLFGWQTITDTDRVVAITEGEIDAMSLHEYGIPALSVPFGGGKGAKQQWIEYEYENLDRFSEIYLCLDNDATGREAVEEIVSRLGAHRCRIVTLPHKDANECLMQGVTGEEIARCFATAETLDPQELKKPNGYLHEVVECFYPSGGKLPGFDLPWKKIPHRLLNGELSIWTGINGHGKSILLGQILTHAIPQNHKAVIASFEMPPRKTLARIVRQMTGKEMPNREEIIDAVQFINPAIWIFDLVGTAKKQRLMDVFFYAHKRYGITQFVIDSLMKCGICDDDYNGQKAFVEELCDFCKTTKAHVHLVAHARKGSSEMDPPNKMDIKGTGSLTDLADNVFCVHRNKRKEQDMGELLAGNGGAKGREDLDKEYDTFLLWHKSREYGGEAEGSYGLYFNRAGQSFFEGKP